MQTLPSNSSSAMIHVLRLSPGADLKQELTNLAAAKQWSAATVVTCVGSLIECNLRFANQKEGRVMKGHFEIISLVGTLSKSAVHLHLCVADEQGLTTGGHVLAGNRIYTTAEIAIAELPDLIFERSHDPASGYKELHVIQKTTR